MEVNLSNGEQRGKRYTHTRIKRELALVGGNSYKQSSSTKG